MLKKGFSKVFNKEYFLTDKGEVVFDGWLRYTPDELKELTDNPISDNEKRFLHKIKETFNGKITHRKVKKPILVKMGKYFKS